MSSVAFFAFVVVAGNLYPPTVALLALVKHYFHTMALQLYGVAAVVLAVAIRVVAHASEEALDEKPSGVRQHVGCLTVTVVAGVVFGK